MVQSQIVEVPKPAGESLDNGPLKLILGLDDGRVVWAAQGEGIFPIHQFNNSVTALARHENRLLVATEDKKTGMYNNPSIIHECPLNFGQFKSSCDGEPKVNDKRHYSYVTSMAVVGDGMYTSYSDGAVFYIFFTENQPPVQNMMPSVKVTGLAYDPNRDDIYVSMSSGELIRFGRTYREKKRMNVVYKHDRILYQGLTTIHVAYDAAWVGTENGHLLKCPLNEQKKKLDCQLFVNLEWSVFSQPTFFNIASRNEYIYAAMRGHDVCQMWQCKPDDPKSCETFDLPETTRAFLLA